MCGLPSNVEFRFYLTRSSKFITRVKWFMFLLFMFTLLDDFQNFFFLFPANARYQEGVHFVSGESSFDAVAVDFLKRQFFSLMFNSCHVGFLLGALSQPWKMS